MKSNKSGFFPKVGEKPFKVWPKEAVVSGFRYGKRLFRFTRAVPVKKDDVFQYIKGVGLKVNNILVKTRAKPWTCKAVQISWVAKKLRVALFQDRDEIWNQRTKKPTGRFDKPYWSAIDLRSYHVGCGDTPTSALKALILQVKCTEDMAREARTRERKRVIRWRCLLSPKEIREMEDKARKTGLILGDLDWRTADWKNLAKYKE